MSKPTIFRPVARGEYVRAIEWYETRRPGLGREFELEVETVIDSITSQPDRYAIAERDIRAATVHRFPYCIYYRERLDQIEILAVFHQSRDPAEWQSRK